MAALIRCLRQSSLKVNNVRVLTSAVQSKSSCGTDVAKRSLLLDTAVRGVTDIEELSHVHCPHGKQASNNEDFTYLPDVHGLNLDPYISASPSNVSFGCDDGQTSNDASVNPDEVDFRRLNQRYHGFRAGQLDWNDARFDIGENFKMSKGPTGSGFYIDSGIGPSINELLSSAVVQCSAGQSEFVNATTGEEENEGLKKARKLEHLQTVKNFCIEVIPQFFVKTTFVTPLYDQEIEFENNYFKNPHYCRGINPYVQELVKIRLKARLRYAHLKTKLIKVTVHPENSSVEAHWRVVTISHFEILKFWKFSLMDKEKNTKWHDGISTLYVNSEGNITKHRIDRVTPLSEPVTVKNADLLTKVAGVS